MFPGHGPLARYCHTGGMPTGGALASTRCDGDSGGRRRVLRARCCRHSVEPLPTRRVPTAVPRRCRHCAGAIGARFTGDRRRAGGRRTVARGHSCRRRTGALYTRWPPNRHVRHAGSPVRQRLGAYANDGSVRAASGAGYTSETSRCANGLLLAAEASAQHAWRWQRMCLSPTLVWLLCLGTSSVGRSQHAAVVAATESFFVPRAERTSPSTANALHR